MADEAEPSSTRTGRDGQSAKERAFKQQQAEFASTPEGRMMLEMKAEIARLAAKVDAQEQDITALQTDAAAATALLDKLKALLSPRGAHQIWATDANVVPDWRDTEACP